MQIERRRRAGLNSQLKPRALKCVRFCIAAAGAGVQNRIFQIGSQRLNALILRTLQCTYFVSLT